MPESEVEAPKKEHPVKRLQRENAELRAKVAALEARPAPTATEAVLTSPGLSVSTGAEEPVSKAQFFMHIVAQQLGHQGLTAFAPEAINGLLANCGVAYDTYCRMVRESDMTLAKAREGLAIRARQDAEITAIEQKKRDERLAHRKMLAGLKGGASVRRLTDRGHTPEDAAVLAAVGAGLPAPEPN